MKTESVFDQIILIADSFEVYLPARTDQKLYSAVCSTQVIRISEL